MKKNIRLPFQNMGKENWVNLAIVATFAFYVIQVGFLLIRGSRCLNYAGDFCAYYSAGKVIQNHDFASIYNLDILLPYQKRISFPNSDPSINIVGLPVPYLPVFILPFYLLSLLNLPFSILLWTLINFFSLLYYLNYFSKKTAGDSLSAKFLFLIVISLPMYINFLESNVNVWLLICMGEFVRAIHSNKSLKAGFWLGGLLLKPLLLILIIPLIIYKRAFKELLGFSISSIIIAMISFSLVGQAGFLNLLNILFFYTGESSKGYLAMMNWRMIGVHISSLSYPFLGQVVTFFGILGTTYATYKLFNKKIVDNLDRLLISLIGIFSSTFVLSWHSHIHMFIILFPPMIVLIKNKIMNVKLFLYVVFIPALTSIVSYLLFMVIEIGHIQINISQLSGFIRGFPSFVLSLILLGWSINKLNHAKVETTDKIVPTS